MGTELRYLEKSKKKVFFFDFVSGPGDGSLMSDVQADVLVDLRKVHSFFSSESSRMIYPPSWVNFLRKVGKFKCARWVNR